MRTLVAGTRGSALALWQTRHVCTELLPHRGSAAALKVKIIVTRGDVDLRDRLQGSLEKGFFTEELEAELRDEQIDLAVHSLKDLPTRTPTGLTWAPCSPRETPADLLVAEGRGRPPRPAQLPLKTGARVGTVVAAPRLDDRPLRARLHAPSPCAATCPPACRSCGDGKYDAIVLAAAGVARLGLDLAGLRGLRARSRALAVGAGPGRRRRAVPRRRPASSRAGSSAAPRRHRRGRGPRARLPARAGGRLHHALRLLRRERHHPPGPRRRGPVARTTCHRRRPSAIARP